MPVERDADPDAGSHRIFLPLDQAERAAQPQVDQLLPLRAYQRVTALIEAALPHEHPEASEDAYLSHRIHNAVLIDGKRGSGKSTIIVNLKRYVEALPPNSRGWRLADQIHILRPIDPTQLEDDDDLLLNVVVAALLADGDFKKAQAARPGLRNDLHDSLQALGKALEGRQARAVIDGDRGLDRLRNFVGSQGLAQAIHDFFVAAARVLGKRLIVMPIDDVDTTLHRAYENLEVVRRYLATPVVLPVLCGELRLFDEVIWRDAFGRLTRDGACATAGAEQLARELAHEYERKVLPLRSRVQMPDIEEILRDRRVLLGTRAEDAVGMPLLPLPLFRAFLRVMLGGPVNGLENCTLELPVRTMRALAQLVANVHDLVPFVAEVASQAHGPIGRLLQRVSAIAEGGGEAAWQETRSSDTGAAQPVDDHLLTYLCDAWRTSLQAHFHYEPSAGPVVLTLTAAQHWRRAGLDSVLATPLFLPLQHERRDDLFHFDRPAPLAWNAVLDGRLPGGWLDQLPKRAILPFPAPEPGQAIRAAVYRFEVSDEIDEERRADFDLLVELVLHRDYYAPDKRAPLICVGRVFELVVMSLVREVTPAQIETLLAQSPFHSASAVATDTTLSAGASDDDRDDDALEPSESASARKHAVWRLASNIKSWRRWHDLEGFSLSPWLTYNAIVKALNQAMFFNPPRNVGASPKNVSIQEVAWRARVAFHALWAAFGSYEKGPLFGMPAVTSKVNVLGGARFENSDPFRQNIRPFLQSRSPDDVWTSVTRALSDHPLRTLVEALPVPGAEDPDRSLRLQLELPPQRGDLTRDQVRNALLALSIQRSIDVHEFGQDLMDFLISNEAPRADVDLLALVLNDLRRDKR